MRALGASTCLAGLFLLFGCTSTENRWQCWQQCARETYPECRIEPEKRLAARHATHRVAGNAVQPPTEVGALTMSDDLARLPRHCLDERAACIKFCDGNEDHIPRADTVLRAAVEKPADSGPETAATK